MSLLGACVYYLKFVLHEFTDAKCTVALRHTASAMQRGYSKIFIEEYVLPDIGARAFHGMLDMVLMFFNPGMVRTLSQWKILLHDAGLTLNAVHHPVGDGPSIIEAELL